jgi:hypothetical protein
MTNIPGATAASYTTPPGTLADQHTLFRCVVANAAGSVTSGTEMFFVTTTPTAPNKITSPLTIAAQVGIPLSYTITSSGGTTPITYSASSLPAGLSLNAGSGVISGTPTIASTNEITIGATNSAGATSSVLELTLTPAPPLVPLAAWRALHFGASATNPDVAGDPADPDGDGVANIVEYATGTDPLTPSALPVGGGRENRYLTATSAKNPQATNLTWGAESGSNPSFWSATGTTVLQDTSTLFKARDNTPATNSGSRFLRLRVNTP